jgi:hypothetical protein
VTNLEFCGEGLSVELWLWFTYTIGYHESGIITSGFGKDNSRGFKIFLKYHHVCMEIHMANTMYKACVGPLGKPTYWLHVLATWDVVDGITLLGIYSNLFQPDCPLVFIGRVDVKNITFCEKLAFYF